jgi:hypothetical protein
VTCWAHFVLCIEATDLNSAQVQVRPILLVCMRELIRRKQNHTFHYSRYLPIHLACLPLPVPPLPELRIRALLAWPSPGLHCQCQASAKVFAFEVRSTSVHCFSFRRGTLHLSTRGPLLPAEAGRLSGPEGRSYPTLHARFYAYAMPNTSTHGRRMF